MTQLPGSETIRFRRMPLTLPRLTALALFGGYSTTVEGPLEVPTPPPGSRTASLVLLGFLALRGGQERVRRARAGCRPAPPRAGLPVRSGGRPTPQVDRLGLQTDGRGVGALRRVVFDPGGDRGDVRPARGRLLGGAAAHNVAGVDALGTLGQPGGGLGPTYVRLESLTYKTSAHHPGTPDEPPFIPDALNASEAGDLGFEPRLLDPESSGGRAAGSHEIAVNPL